jgi:transketolase
MANAIRALAMDAVEQAKAGHPGLPMGAADIATVLFMRFLALTRQNLPQLRRGFDEMNRCALGAYELSPAEDDDAVVSLFATGSEVTIAVAAKKLLAERKVSARVVSVPCFELLFAAPQAKRAAIIGEARVNVAIEAGIRQGWDAIIGSDGVFIGMTTFGASGPYKELYQHFGITAEKVAEAALARIS